MCQHPPGFSQGIAAWSVCCVRVGRGFPPSFLSVTAADFRVEEIVAVQREAVAGEPRSLRGGKPQWDAFGEGESITSQKII